MLCCNVQQAPPQTIFLGCSVSNFSASMGWETGLSDLSITLREDNCQGYRVFWNECLELISGNYTDAGFFGENRYQRSSDSTYYSSCVKEDPSDTLVRNAIDLVGMPVYFRIGVTAESFEYAGIISDWVRNNTTEGPEYRVKIVDPRLILEGCQIIIGDYTGAVDGYIDVIDGGTGEPQTNLFNVYGFLEQFGVFAPSYSQCTPGVYTPTATCTNVDGPVFGTFVGGFGGSRINTNGMPYTYIIHGLNYLINSFVPVPAVISSFSPYARVAFHANDIPVSLSGVAAGLIKPDTGTGMYDNKNYYFVDLSELPDFPDTTYRIGGTSISILELVNKAAEDLNFNYYFELLPVKDPSNQASSNCVCKIIKLRTVRRTNQYSLDKICEFIETASDCVLSSSFGEELRNETMSNFIIGGLKQTVYQAESVYTNPDADFTSPSNDTSTVVSIDSMLGTLRSETGCTEIDNIIVPYFGVEANGDMIIPCMDASGNWEFYAPVWTVQPKLQIMSFSGTHVLINEMEIRAALHDFRSWHGYIQENETDTYAVTRSFDSELEIAQAAIARVGGGANLPHDFVNPKLTKFKKHDDTIGQKETQDLYTIHGWVRSYGERYYGQQFAVRTPFTTAVYDPESLQPVLTEVPTNDGGWTELSYVIGLPNGGPLSAGQFEVLNYFRDPDNKIQPFVRFNNALTLDISDLAKEDFWLHFTILSGSTTTGAGPPAGVPGANITYTDTLTGLIYVYFRDHWVLINESCIMTGDGAPPTTTFEYEDFCPVYFDYTNELVYVATSVTYAIDNVTVSTWGLEVDVKLYVKGRVQEEYVFHDKSNFFVPRVIIEVPKIPIAETYTPQLQMAVLDPDQKEALGRVGGDSARAGFAVPAAMIDAAAISLKHQTLTYGPWLNPTVVGRTNIINDPGMVPWRYNGFVGLNLAGQQLANESRVQMRKGELGTITVVGHPTIPLGAELNAINDGFFSGENLIENRVLGSGSASGLDYDGNLVSVAYARFLFDSAWDGTHGPNVTDIQVQMGDNGAQTTYNMRTFSPRRGFFQRYYANKIEQTAAQQIVVKKLLNEHENILKARLTYKHRKDD